MEGGIFLKQFSTRCVLQDDPQLTRCLLKTDLFLFELEFEFWHDDFSIGVAILLFTI